MRTNCYDLLGQKGAPEGAHRGIQTQNLGEMRMKERIDREWCE
ncbi:MAG TPA: hypothetical protein VMV59_03250 [Candidatus Dormibacteraeota bacterium]|nr:hypothetical protein [Candidatus Dormibacteraeota bacterium]